MLLLLHGRCGGSYGPISYITRYWSITSTLVPLKTRLTILLLPLCKVLLFFLLSDLRRFSAANFFFSFSLCFAICFSSLAFHFSSFALSFSSLALCFSSRSFKFSRLVSTIAVQTSGFTCFVSGAADG